MDSQNNTYTTIDEYIAQFPPEIQDKADRDPRSDQGCRTPGKRKDQLPDAHLLPAGQPGTFRSAQDAYRLLPRPQRH